MRFDKKLFRYIFAYSIILILAVSIILLSLFYKQYSDSRKANLYFLNALLQTQSGNNLENFKRSAGEVSNGRDMENFLGSDPVARLFAEKILKSYFESVIDVYPIIREIRIVRGRELLFSTSPEPIEIEAESVIARNKETIYRLLVMDTLQEDIHIVYLISVNNFLSDFDALHRIPSSDIVYVIDKTWAVVFDDGKNQSRLYTVDEESGSDIIVNGKHYFYSGVDIHHIVGIAVSRDSLYESIRKSSVVLVVFALISGIILFFIIRLISRSLTLPIRRLSDHASSVNKTVLPDFNYDGDMVDEVKSLMISLNYMAREVRDFTGRLEQEVSNRTQVIEEQKLELEKISLTDKLTGLNNRRSFDERIARDFDLAARTGLYIGLGIIDIDYFKQVNDNFGHLCGDEILKGISALLIDVFRRNCDNLFRYGGDEFIILTLNNEDQRAEFVSLAEKLRSRVEAHQFSCHEEEPLRLSISTGLFFGKVDQKESFQDILNIADDMLYKVKDEGRNRVKINGS